MKKLIILVTVLCASLLVTDFAFAKKAGACGKAKNECCSKECQAQCRDGEKECICKDACKQACDKNCEKCVCADKCKESCELASCKKKCGDKKDGENKGECKREEKRDGSCKK